MQLLIGMVLGFSVAVGFWFKSDQKHDWKGKIECESNLPTEVSCVWMPPPDEIIKES